MTIDWDKPGYVCTVCRGTGKVELESASGSHKDLVTCPYCSGKGDSKWVAQKRAKRVYSHNSNRMIVRGIVGLSTIAMWHYSHLAWWSATGSHTLALMGAWLVILAGWGVYFACFPKQGKRHVSKHAPGFTTDREKASAAALVAGVGIKKGFENWEHRQHG